MSVGADCGGSQIMLWGRSFWYCVDNLLFCGSGKSVVHSIENELAYTTAIGMNSSGIRGALSEMSLSSQALYWLLWAQLNFLRKKTGVYMEREFDLLFDYEFESTGSAL